MCIYNFDRYCQVIFHRQGTKMALVPAMYEEAHTSPSEVISLLDLCCSQTNDIIV